MSALAPRLELRQGQSLVMTQQLQQSIKLLQLSALELTEFIEQEMEKNPLLTVEDQDASSVEQAEDTHTEKEEPEASDPEEGEEDLSVEAWQDSGEEENHPAGDGDVYTPRISGRSQEGDDDAGFESFTASTISLHDYLLDQLQVEVSDSMQRIVAQHLIDLVDESGYIKEDTGHITTLLNCDASLIESTFATLHTFDPAGICARTLAECLAIQLREKNRLDPAMECLLQHLDLVARGDMDALSKRCGVDVADIREMCAEIRALNPRPGAVFSYEATQAIEPDAFLKRTKGGGWQVELNTGVLPRVLVNRRYYAQLSKKTRGTQEKKYLSDQLAVANWLVKALDQRAQTILKVSTEIVAQQDGFFRQGIKFLRPLTLREVADAVDLHESTVSRVTTNKYLLTPRGTYELKYFFSASIHNAAGGEGHANKTVQHLIKEMIDQENGNAILSDDAIALRLKIQGIDIARRTVAKYRELLRIPTSSARKREKIKKMLQETK